MLPIFPYAMSGKMLQGKTDLGMSIFDLQKGVGKVGQNSIRLKQLMIESGDKPLQRRYTSSPWLPTMLLKPGPSMNYGVLIDDRVLNTVFTRMFLLDEYNDTFFQPVLNESPLFSLYRVTGDVYSSDAGSEQ